jgi:alpha-beta hydrolase superfamily lysophospholipase
MRKMLASCALCLLGIAGCVDIKTDPSEEAGPIVQFDPADSIIPFPNNLVLDPMTGKVNLPKQCGESVAQGFIRTTLLNKLDGFGTYESALQVTLSDPVDAASLTGHVLLYQAAKGTTPTNPVGAQPIPVVVIPGTTTQFSVDCSSNQQVTSLTIIPQGALEQHSTYVVALTKGIKTSSGTEFGPSFTWAVIDQADPPVVFDNSGNVTTNLTPLHANVPADLEQLQGIALLYGAHKAPLDYLAATGNARADVLVAWSFNTQTTTDPLDPTVAGTPAANIGTGPLVGVTSLTANIDRANPPFNQCDAAMPAETDNAQCFLKISLGGKTFDYDTGNAVCAQIGCAAVKDVLGGALLSKDYQQELLNPLSGGQPVPGPWSDAVHPALVKTATIPVFIIVPLDAIPAAGTVVFGHGLGSNKGTAIAIGPQLASKGFSTVAIDFVAHGARAVQTSNAAAKGCDGTPTLDKLQCFAPFLSSDLAGTRDNIRQTVLDLEGLVAALKACGTTNCGALKVDSAHLSYMGISLGGIVGSTAVASVPDFKSAVLNVPGVGLIDILENTASLTIRCSLVDALISVGVVTGTPFNPSTMTGTCTTDAWKAQPGYQQFSVIGRWVLDPGDGANFTRKLATRKILLQEVVNDQVVPNIATEREAALLGLMGAAATADKYDPGSANGTLPSAAITTAPTANKFVRYPTLPMNGAFPGNAFSHSSLLDPGTTAASQLATARVQTDAITFLVVNH